MKTIKFILLSAALILSAQTITCNENAEKYYGKTLKEAKKNDQVLQEAFDQSSGDIRSHKFTSFFKKPSSSFLNRSKKNLLLLKEKVALIDLCLEKAHERLKELKNRQQTTEDTFIKRDYSDAHQMSEFIAALPWMGLVSLWNSHSVSEVEHAIDIMNKTKLEIETLIKALEKILAKNVSKTK